MGQFIEQVQRINQDNNHKYRVNEEKENVKNALFKRFLEEFRKSNENYEDTYSNLVKIKTMKQICTHDFDFGMHVTLEFIYTTYHKELEKVYKMFKKEEKSVLAREKLCEELKEQEEKERLAHEQALDNIKTERIFTLKNLWLIPVIALMCYLGFYALLGFSAILLLLFVILIN